MHLITRQSLANSALARWRRQYPNGHPNGNIATALERLGPTPNPDAVDAVIGNTSWTSPGSCDECGKAADELVEVGEPPDYESSTARLCVACAVAAVRAFGVAVDIRANPGGPN